MTPDIKLVVISKAISCPTRMFLLRVIGAKGCTVTAAAERAEVTISTASYHLRHLVAAGLAKMKRNGRTRVYQWGKARWYLMSEERRQAT